MANSLFALTPSAINKVVGSAWNDDSQLLCHMADGIANLTSDAAKGKFAAILSQLGIKLVETRKVGKITVEIFNASGKSVKSLTDDEKRKAISLALFKTEDSAAMFAQFDGEKLDTLYQNNVKPSKETAPYQLYRIALGSFVVYRVSNDGEEVASLVAKAIRHVIDSKGGKEEDFPLD